MKILYITTNYENIQPKLMDSLIKLGNIPFLFYYELQNKISNADYPDYVSLGQSRGVAHGPLLYLYKLNKAYKQATIIAEENNIDVIHGNMAFCDGYIARKIAKKKNIPFVVSVRSTDAYNKFLWKLPHIRKIGIENLKDAKAVVFLSNSTKKTLLEKLPADIRDLVEKKSKTIPNGIEDYYLHNPFSREKTKDDFKGTLNLVTVGKVNKRKNIENVIKAAEKLILQGWKIELTVAGEIVDSEYLNLFGRTSFVNYVGKKGKEELVKLYRNADIFVLPSHIETFGLVYAEALSQGLPIIYTKGQGFDGYFPDGEVGFSVEDNNPDDIANKLLRVVDDYQAISNNCLERSLNFNWLSIGERIIKECYI